MEIKRCARCGQFYETINDVCNGCLAKDNKDIGKLKNYFSYGYSAKDTKNDISANTGITVKNLNRLLTGSEFEGVFIRETLETVEVEQQNTKKTVAKV